MSGFFCTIACSMFFILGSRFGYWIKASGFRFPEPPKEPHEPSDREGRPT